jgi:hypothetical protein
MRDQLIGRDPEYVAKLAAAERGRDYQITEFLNITALPGGFVVHAGNDQGSRNRKSVISNVDDLAAAVQAWANEASNGK